MPRGIFELGVLVAILGLAYGQDLTGISYDATLTRLVHFRSLADTEGYLLTSSSMAGSTLNPNAKTVVLIDGFLSTQSTSNMTKFLRRTFLTQFASGVNLICVYWDDLSGGHSPLLNVPVTELKAASLTLFPLVLPNVVPVGRRVGEVLKGLIDNGLIRPNTTQIIGHSMGAHIAGNAGAYLVENSVNVSRITGMDPAGPIFWLGQTFVLNALFTRIQSGQADWVDLFHTGLNGMGDSSTGYGDIDIYVNGGMDQPGCVVNPQNLIQKPYCDHSYSWKSYNATITHQPSEWCSTACCTELGFPIPLFGSCYNTLGQQVCPVGSNVYVGYWSRSNVGADEVYLEDENEYPWPPA